MPSKPIAKATPSPQDGPDDGRREDNAKSGAREIATRLRDQIQSGKLKPGEWLREIKLAEELNTGRSALREALRLLERDGLVELEKFRGARVTTPTLFEMFDLFEARAALFGLVVRFACFRASDADLREIVSRIESLVEMAATSTPEERARDSVEIGALITKHASREAREMMAASQRRARWRFLYLGLPYGGDTQGPADRWRDLAAKLAVRDANGAACAAREIVYFMQQEVTKALVARGGGEA